MKTQHFYEFKDFRLDPDERVLLRNGSPVYLTPKAFHLLRILVENHGHIVDKEKLIGEIWADSFVEDGNLAVNATVLRKALEDNAASPTFIETVPRRGYRFIAPVRHVDEDEPADDAISSEFVTKSPRSDPQSSRYSQPTEIESNREDDVKAQAVPTALHENGVIAANASADEFSPDRLQSRALIVVAAVAALLLGGLGLYFYLQSNRDIAIAGKKSIAVLPVKPITATGRDELYELGIAESLILKLSSVKDLDVRPLSATRRYDDLSQDPLVAGRQQQVDYVLDSNYQLADGKIRVTARLFSVATGDIEDTYTIARDSANVFEMQDAVAAQIGNRVFERFGFDESEYTAKRGTDSEEAYRLYLQGKYLHEKRALAASVKAVDLLDEAIRLDPDYARAWAVKSFAHFVKTTSSRSASPDIEIQKALEAANKALQLDGNLSEGHAALCEIKTSYEWDLPGAERACTRAVELDPNSTLARQTHARLLMAIGRFDEATAQAQAAIDLEPASLLNHRIYGCTFFEARRFDEAIAVFKRTIDLDPNSGSAIYFWLVEALYMKGDHDEAFEWFLKMRTLEKADEKTLQGYRTAYRNSGWQGVLMDLDSKFEKSDMTYFGGVYTNIRLGRKDKAYEYLEKAFQRREWPFAYIKVEPRLDPLRNDPRFADLVRRVERK